MTLAGITSSYSASEQLYFLHETCAVNTSNQWTRISGHGRDVIDYLHRRLSNSMKSIPSGSGTHALQLDGNGLMQADLLAYRVNDGFEILTRREHADTTLQLLEKYTLMDDASFRFSDQQEIILSLAGPSAPQALSGSAGVPTAWSVFDQTLANHRCLVFQDGRWQIPYFHVAVAQEALADVTAALGEKCRSLGGGIVSDEALDFCRIDQGITQFGLDTTPSTIPLEAALYGTIDFDKGCFPGQEFIARINNLGHPAHRLARFEMEGEHVLTSGDTVHSPEPSDDKTPMGRITSSRTLPGLGRTIALGYVRWKSRDLAACSIVNSICAIQARITPIGIIPDNSGKKRGP